MASRYLTRPPNPPVWVKRSRDRSLRSGLESHRVWSGFRDQRPCAAGEPAVPVCGGAGGTLEGQALACGRGARVLCDPGSALSLSVQKALSGIKRGRRLSEMLLGK